MKTLWPAGLAVLAAVLVAVVRPPDTPLSRLTNLDLASSGFPSIFLMISKTDPTKAYVVDRRDSTIRRSNSKQPGQKWDLLRIADDDGNAYTDSWLVKSKRKGKGTVLFVPAIDVRDWSYPFFYNFVAGRKEQLDLPSIDWAQLYVNRVYHGLFLRISLPFDLRKKDGGTGILREVISVDGNRSYHLNTRLESVPGLYAEKVSESHFPRLADVPPELRWLESLNSSGVRTYIMSNVLPFDVSYWPVPVNLSKVYETAVGESPLSYLDSRVESWRPASEQPDPPFNTQAMQEMNMAFADYEEKLSQAIELTARFHQSEELYRQQFPKRQYAAQKLGLTLEPF